MSWIVIFEHDLKLNNAVRTHLLEFCEAMTRYDPVVLVSHADETELGENWTFDSKKVTAISFRPNFLSYIVNTLILFFYLWRIHPKRTADVVYVRATAFGWGALIFARLFGLNSILEINGAWREEIALTSLRWKKWKRFILSPVIMARSHSIDISCHLAKKIVTVTPQLADYVHSIGIDEAKIIVASNGANIDHFKPLDMQICRERLNLEQGIKTIGFVGNLAGWQGTDDLLNAYATVSVCETEQHRLLIIGDGVEFDRLVELSHTLSISDRVIFKGAKPYSHIPSYIGACNIMVVPKRPLSSGYSPLKVYEYMACGRPILASNVPGLGFVEEQGFGVLFEAGNVEDLSYKLSSLMTMNDEELHTMGDLARQVAVSSYSWDATVRQIRTVASLPS